MGVKYRMSSEFELFPEGIRNINGFKGGIGIKVGIVAYGPERSEIQFRKDYF